MMMFSRARLRSPAFLATMAVPAVLALSISAACVKDDFKDGFPCSMNNECPTPFQCQAGRCYRHPVDASTMGDSSTGTGGVKVDGGLSGSGGGIVVTTGGSGVAGASTGGVGVGVGGSAGTGGLGAGGTTGTGGNIGTGGKSTGGSGTGGQASGGSGSGGRAGGATVGGAGMGGGGAGGIGGGGTCETEGCTCSLDNQCGQQFFCALNKCRVDAAAVSLGETHACARLTDGTLRCWGANNSGQLGDGKTAEHLTPTAVPGISAVKLVAGDRHSCVILPDKTVACWGDNSLTQLAESEATLAFSSTPKIISGVTAAFDLSATKNSTCALQEGGMISCWGSIWNRSDYKAGIVNTIAGATTIASGESHVCVLAAGGRVLCWGDNTYGQLGINAPATKQSATPVPVIRQDTEGELTGATILAASGSTTCAVVSGSLYCWGYNFFSSAGVSGQQVVHAATVVKDALASPLTNVTSVALGIFHTCAVFGVGTVSCWGGNDSGQLGNGGPGGPTPTVVSGVTGAVAVGIGISNSTCAVLVNGSLSCWGANQAGELGNGVKTTQPVSSPVSVSPW